MARGQLWLSIPFEYIYFECLLACWRQPLLETASRGLSIYYIVLFEFFDFSHSPSCALLLSVDVAVKTDEVIEAALAAAAAGAASAATDVEAAASVEATAAAIAAASTAAVEAAAEAAIAVHGQTLPDPSVSGGPDDTSHETHLANRRQKDRARYASMSPEQRQAYNSKRRQQYHKQSNNQRQKRRDRERERYHSVEDEDRRKRNQKRAEMERLRYKRLNPACGGLATHHCGVRCRSITRRRCHLVPSATPARAGGRGLPASIWWLTVPLRVCRSEGSTVANARPCNTTNKATEEGATHHRA